MQFPTDDPISAWLRRKYPQLSFLDPYEAAANRRGELTPAQRSSLNWKLASESLTAIVFLLIGFGLPLCVGAALILTTPRDISPAAFLWALALGGGACLLGLPGIVNGIRRWKSFITARREIADNDVAEGIGTVVWSGDIYVAVVNGHRLRPIYNKLNLPPAMHYRFHYLRSTYWLLSAEKVEQVSTQEATQLLFNTLTVTNRFRASDLDMNRSGRITVRQRLRMGWSLLARLWGVAVLCWVVIPFLSMRWFGQEYSLFQFVAESIIFALLAQILGVFTLLVDVIRGRVAKTEGAGQRQKPQGRGEHHHYVFGNLRFEVSRQAYNALIIGKRYRVYYMPLSKKLLSIEPMPDVAKLTNGQPSRS